MRYRPTILNISAGLFLMAIGILTIFEYEALSSGEGWGMLAMIAFAVIGLIAGVVDLILQLLIRNRKVLNIIGPIIVVGLGILLR